MSRLTGLRGSTRLVALPIVRVMGCSTSLAMCRKIQGLFLVIIARCVWVILIQKVLELGEDVLALVLHDQVLLLL